MKNKKIVLFPFAKYVVPADFETFLENLAKSGWQIDKIGKWSSIIIIFKKAEPKKCRFVFDLQTIPKKNYKDIYKDFGWELVGNSASAYIWRKAYTNERPEAFTDKDSLKIRSKNAVIGKFVSFFTFIAILTALIICLIVMFNKLSEIEIIQFKVGIGFSSLLAICLGNNIMKIYKNRTK